MKLEEIMPSKRLELLDKIWKFTFIVTVNVSAG
jgi:hypothetical protein